MNRANPEGQSPRLPFINGQHLSPYAGIPYGRSTIGRSGCEAIATYNFLLLIGRPASFESVIDFYVRRFRAHPLSGWGRQGVWGAAPRDIAAFLKAAHIPYRSAGTVNRLSAVSDGPGAYILSYWNRPITSGYHTIAVSFNGSQYTAYNRDCDRSVPITGTSLSDFMDGNGRFIRGFFYPLHFAGKS